MVRMYAYRIFLVLFLIVLTIVGIFIGFQLAKNEPIKEATTVVNNEEDVKDEDEVKIYTPVVAKTYDIELVYEDYYSVCKETIISKNMVYGITLDELKQREEQKQEKLGDKYEIKEASNERLVYTKTINGYCPSHFKLVLNNKQNKVVIYNLEDEENNRIYKELEIYKNTLREELLDKLEEGIEVDSVKELNLIIEDIES